MTRFTIPLNQLTQTSSSAQHIVRFRVVSEDRNRISDWSPIFLLQSVGQIPSASVEFVSTVSATTPKKVEITWSGGYAPGHTDLDPEPHDIFVKWSTSALFQYVGRVIGNNFSIIAPASATNVIFKIQTPSYPSEHPPNPDNTPRESSIIQILETTVISL